MKYALLFLIATTCHAGDPLSGIHTSVFQVDKVAHAGVGYALQDYGQTITGNKWIGLGIVSVFAGVKEGGDKVWDWTDFSCTLTGGLMKIGWDTLTHKKHKKEFACVRRL